MAETNAKKAPIRVVTIKGEPVALVRAKSERAAINHVTQRDYAAPIADQDTLVACAPKFTVEIAGEDREADAEQAETRG